MADPKRKQSQTRGRKRRTHYKAKLLFLIKCAHCEAKIRPHRICPICGYYKGKPYIVKKVKEKKDQQAA